MSSSYVVDPIVFLIQTLFGLYASLVAVRFLLQWARADFYNPISQFVVKVTSPVLRPLRRVIPGYGGYDLAALLVVWLLTATELGIVALLLGVDRVPFGAFGWAVPAVVELFINIFLVAVLLRAVLSWFSPDPYNPGVALLVRITEPVLRPAQRILRPISGIDLSPMLAVIGLILLNMLLIPPLRWLVGSPF